MERARTESGEHLSASPGGRCLSEIAAELGCTVEALPKRIIAAVAAFGCSFGQHVQGEADLAATTPPPAPAGRYRVQSEEVTRVTGTRRPRG